MEGGRDGLCGFAVSVIETKRSVFQLLAKFLSVWGISTVRTILAPGEIFCKGREAPSGRLRKIGRRGFDSLRP